MRFTEVEAHLAVALREPLAEFTELLRALREGSTELADMERTLAAEGDHVDWGEGGFTNLLRGKPGPGGGFEASPPVLSYYLTGYLCDCPRRETAKRALEMTFAVTRGQACSKTKKKRFGSALAATLADPSLFAQCVDVGVSSDLGMAYLDFASAGEEPGPGTLPQIRSLFATPAYDFAPSGSYSVRHLYPFMLRPLMSLIQTEAARPERAGNARARKRQPVSHA